MIPSAILLAGASLADLSLLALFATLRTDAPLNSPWQLVSPLVFVVFALGTAAVWWAAAERQDGWLTAAVCLHACTAASVSALTYRLGFGFDPLLHQAAEIAWQKHGPSVPFTILYSGQYALVAGIARITHLSVLSVDRWLVPILAAITPFVAVNGLRSAWQVPRRFAARATFALFLVPFSLFTFTIPYHLAAILFLWVIAWLPAQNLRTRLLLSCLAGLAVVSHPLAGIPALGLVAGNEVLRHLRSGRLRRVSMALFFCLMAGALPAAFLWLYRHQLSEVVDVHRLFAPAPWLGLFRDPYPFAGWSWEFLYFFRHPAPLLLTAMAAGAVWRIRSTCRPAVQTLISCLTGLLASTYLLATLFRFPNIISAEQYEFPLRLLQLVPLAAFPLFALVIARADERLTSPVRRALCGVGVVALCTAAWYFSYPQWNAKAHWSGPSASAQDVAIVTTIERHASGTPHIVLAPPITAAVAVRSFGFRNAPAGMLWYPLPTGGRLYPFFLRLNTEINPALAAEAALLAGVRRVYVVGTGKDSSTPPALHVEPYDILVHVYDTP